MTNQEHLDVLKQGVVQWNAWMRETFRPVINLGGADLSGANLSEVNLLGANLSGANLSGASLYLADFTKANLSDARLHDADLRRAKLFGADLRETLLINTNLSKADFRFADLTGANFEDANLSGAHLRDANFDNVYFSRTIFTRVDLRFVKNLEKARHGNRSTVDLLTVRLPLGATRLAFLQGVGFPDIIIDYLPSLLTTAIEYASCFISYAHQDEALAKRLHKDLQGKGVRCWFAPEDMKIGDKIRTRIDEAIHLHDKLLLLLSEHAIASTWVEDEVESALEKEQQQQREVLFPVRLDELVMQTSQAWAAKLRRTRHIGDFTHWTDPQAYQQTFERLLRDLKTQP